MTSLDGRRVRREFLARKAEALQSALLHGTAPLRSVLDRLKRQRVRTHEQVQELLVECTVDDRHCLSCGNMEGNSRYCPGCGKPTARRLECRRCKDVIQLPVHLFRDDVCVNGLHCVSCGEPHQALNGASA